LLPGLHAQEHAQCQQQPDGGVFQPGPAIPSRGRLVGVNAGAGAHHALFDRAKDALAVSTQHLDADGVAKGMKSVTGAPVSMVSMARFSATHE
jgi:hypothetical protein